MIKGYKIKNKIFQDSKIGQLKYSNEFYSNYKKHSHDQFSICAIASGMIEIEFSDKKETLQPNQLLILHKDEVHKSSDLRGDTKGYYVFYFENSLINDGLFENILQDQELYNSFIELCQSFLEKKNGMEQKLYKFFQNLSLWANDTIELKENTLINTIQNFIDKNIDLDLSLEDIVKEFSYSKEHIIRLFKKEFGLTPYAYIINQKLNRSKKLLSSHEFQNISQVSQECGFYDQSHFCKSFKSIYAMTPNRFLELQK